MSDAGDGPRSKTDAMIVAVVHDSWNCQIDVRHAGAVSGECWPIGMSTSISSYQTTGRFARPFSSRSTRP
ncbi:hypothetical protein C478_06536 [Natrinema thermotolerans DSM 11552]|nr:hypothetical protein C478_06536 [Natrinema thermotolerans DSM 11552]